MNSSLQDIQSDIARLASQQTQLQQQQQHQQAKQLFQPAQPQPPPSPYQQQYQSNIPQLVSDYQFGLEMVLQCDLNHIVD